MMGIKGNMTIDVPTNGEALLGKTLGGKYVVEALIGEGSMGWVYRARQQPLKRQVALKVMRDMPGDELMLQRFTREAEVIAQLEHPNSITLYDFGSTRDGRVFLVMKYVQGQTLRNLLDTEGAIPLERAVRIIEQICGSLAEAHSAGITHRDVKPANIMLSERFGLSDVVTVVDFGVAKDADGTSITGAGQVIGTPAYMAPELAGGAGSSPASDIYSLGCMLYEMLTGAPPFGKLSAFTLVYKHVNLRPPPLPQDVADRCGPRLGKLLDRLLHKQPEARPDCQTLITLAKETLQAPAVPPRPRANERLRTMQRMQAIRRRRKAHEASQEFEAPDLKVPESSGRSADAMVDALLDDAPATPPKAIDTERITADQVILPTTREDVKRSSAPRRNTGRAQLPVFKRPQAAGQIRFDEYEGNTRCFGVGMGTVQLHFAAGTKTPKKGTRCAIGLPGEPVSEDLVWVNGLTDSYQPMADGVYVDVRVDPRPSGEFRAMVQYWSLKSRA